MSSPNPEMMSALLQVNRMSYLMAKKMSIASQRHQTTGFPQQSEYTPGRTIILDIQSGNAFINGKASYMTLKVEGVTAVGNFGIGGVGNLFERVVCRARSGQELSRLDTANLMIALKQYYHYDQEYIDTTGAVQGLQGTGAPKALIVGTPQMFVIPLSCFCPFFDQERLMPPQVLEGCRLEITLASPDNALTGVGASYVVKNPQFKFDTYTIADPFVRKISELAATQGLVLQHKELFNVIVTQPTGASDINYDVKKACSQALRSYTFARDSADLSDDTKDSLRPLNFDYETLQCNIGNVYFPNQKLTVDASGSGEAYAYTQLNLGKLWKANSVTPALYASGRSGLVFSYDRSHVSGMSGSAINNSRSLIFNLRSAAPLASRRLDTYLEHLRVVTIFTSNVQVKD